MEIIFSLQYTMKFFFPFNKVYISLKNKTNLIDWYYFCLLTENQDNKMQKKKNNKNDLHFNYTNYCNL